MAEEKSLNFLEEIVESDLTSGKYKSIITRFPPEPNGYLHLGHAKSICLNFGLALKYGGKTNLRFDDTNPITEETEYVDSIKNDVRWLGFEWSNEFYASDYFGNLYEFAITLIKKGLAYADDSTSEEIATQKGTPIKPGTPNVYRSRAIEENLRLFAEMKEGRYKDGEKVLRAKWTWQVRTCTCVTQLYTGSNMPITIAPVTPGVFIRCTILPMDKVTPLKMSPTAFALWSLFRTASCTIGLLKTWRYIHHVSTSLPD